MLYLKNHLSVMQIQGSTLVIQMANETDVGEYVCEISSNPPATLRHKVAMIGKRQLTIL